MPDAFFLNSKSHAVCLGGAGEADGRVPSLQEISELDRQFIEKNLSPGGCADLLAVTLFLQSWAEA